MLQRSERMTKALRIDEDALDKFVTTLLMEHVDPPSQQPLWKTYEEFKRKYDSIIIEDPKEETDKQVQCYKKRVDSFFKKLRDSIKEDSSWTFNETPLTYDYRDTVEVNTILCSLIQSETYLKQQDLKLSYQLGKMFMELKVVKKSIPNMIKSYGLDVSRQYIQEKISIYLLLFDYPRLQDCKVSTSFLIKHRKLFLEEVRCREDCNFWRNQ